MCWPLRSTDSRATPRLRMWARVDLARRRRAVFFSMVIYLAEAEEPLGLLGFLHDDLLAGVADALALVGLRLAERADLGRHLAHLLLVGTADHDLGLRRGSQGDAFRRGEHHRVGEAQVQAQVLALHGGAVTDADQLELAAETLGNANDHVGEDRAGGTGHRHV